MPRKGIIARLLLLVLVTGLGLTVLFVFRSIRPKPTTQDSVHVTKQHHHHRIHRHRRRHHH